jgi:RimJ/RimL family protein N-acetyltransferase
VNRLTLETERLILRPFEDADCEAFAVYRSDPVVARYQGWETPFTLDQAKEFVVTMREIQPGLPGEWYQWAIERRASPGLIGDCAFQVFAHDTRQAEIGFSLAAEHQRHGYGGEAVTRLLDSLLDELRLHRVVAICDVENRGSARLLERVGLRREAHMIENVWFKGAWASEYTYAVLDREWRRPRADGSQPGTADARMDR